MTAVKTYRAVIWKDMNWPFSDPWRVCFLAAPGPWRFVEDLDLRRDTHAEAIQAACGSLRRLNAAAMAQPGEVVDP